MLFLRFTTTLGEGRGRGVQRERGEGERGEGEGDREVRSGREGQKRGELTYTTMTIIATTATRSKTTTIMTIIMMIVLPPPSVGGVGLTLAGWRGREGNINSHNYIHIPLCMS